MYERLWHYGTKHSDHQIYISPITTESRLPNIMLAKATHYKASSVFCQLQWLPEIHSIQICAYVCMRILCTCKSYVYACMHVPSTNSGATWNNWTIPITQVFLTQGLLSPRPAWRGSRRYSRMLGSLDRRNKRRNGGHIHVHVLYMYQLRRKEYTLFVQLQDLSWGA